MPYIFITIQSGGWDPTEPIHLDFSPELDPEIHGFLRDQDQFLSASNRSNSSSTSKTQQQTNPVASSSPVVSPNNRNRNNSSSSSTGAYYYLPPNSPTPPMSGTADDIDRHRSSSINSSNDHPYHNAHPSSYPNSPATVAGGGGNNISDADGDRNPGSTLRMILDGLEKLGFQLVTTSSYSNNNKSYNEFILHRELTPAEIQHQHKQSTLLMPPTRHSSLSSSSPKHRTSSGSSGQHREEKQQHQQTVSAEPTIVNYGAGHITISQPPPLSPGQQQQAVGRSRSQQIGIGSYAQYPAPQ